MTRCTGGREAPRRFSAGLLALGLAAAPLTDAVLVADTGGARLVAVDEGSGEVVRVPLPAPAVALAAFDPTAGFAYAATRDGRVLRVDVARAALAGEVRVGTRAAGLAASADGRFLAVALDQPGTLVVIDRELSVQRALPARDLDGKRASPVTAVRTDARRRSFIATLPGLPELWEVSYDDAAEPIYPGLVHDFRLGEGIAIPGTLNPRRAPLDEPLDDLAVDPFGANVLGTSRASSNAHVINLFVRRRIAAIAGLEGVAANALARWIAGGKAFAALPARDGVRIVEAGEWREVARLALGGSSQLARTHQRSSLLWLAVGERLVLLDKAKLVVAGELRPGGPVVDVAFSRDGAHVFILLDAALVRYDARTLTEGARVTLQAPAVILVP